MMTLAGEIIGTDTADPHPVKVIPSPAIFYTGDSLSGVIFYTVYYLAIVNDHLYPFSTVNTAADEMPPPVHACLFLT